MISENDYKMAALILEHSTQVQENENVMVQLIGLNGINLLRALVEQIREKEHILLYKLKIPKHKSYWFKKVMKRFGKIRLQ